MFNIAPVDCLFFTNTEHHNVEPISARIMYDCQFTLVLLLATRIRAIQRKSVYWFSAYHTVIALLLIHQLINLPVTGSYSLSIGVICDVAPPAISSSSCIAIESIVSSCSAIGNLNSSSSASTNSFSSPTK